MPTEVRETRVKIVGCRQVYSINGLRNELQPANLAGEALV